MKLVRDNIPEIMKTKGKEPIIHIATDEEFMEFLIKKLEEEVIEIKNDTNVEELADLTEVINQIIFLIGSNPLELERVRIEKLKKNGGFSKRIILENGYR